MKISVQALAVITAALISGCNTKTNNVSPQNLNTTQMQKIWEESGKPSGHHTLLNPFIGTWDAEVKSWSEPKSRPEVSTATETNTWVFDGRFVKEDFRGTLMGKPYNGVGYLGYDNVRKHFTSTWMSNAETATWNAHGKINSAGNEINFRGVQFDPISGASILTLAKSTIINGKTRRYEMTEVMPDGTEFKVLEINYKKR